MLKHILHRPSQCQSSDIPCPHKLNVPKTINPDSSISTKLSSRCPRPIYHANITQTYGLGFLNIVTLQHWWYHLVCIKPGLTFTLCISNQFQRNSFYPPEKFVIQSLLNIPDYSGIKIPVQFQFDNDVLPPEQVIHICVDTSYQKYTWTCWSC